MYVRCTCLCYKLHPMPVWRPGCLLHAGTTSCMLAWHPAWDWSNSRRFIHGSNKAGEERWSSRRQGNQKYVLKEVCSSKAVCSPPRLVLVCAQLVTKDGIGGFCGCWEGISISLGWVRPELEAVIPRGMLIYLSWTHCASLFLLMIKMFWFELVGFCLLLSSPVTDPKGIFPPRT